MTTNHQPGCCADGSCTAETCMNLPAGSTCASCLHVRRCSLFGYTEGPDSVWCDFYPRRYRAAEVSHG